MDVAREQAETWASWFRALGDPSRILILNLLATAGSARSVGEIVDELDLAQSTVSHHLKILGEVGFVLVDAANLLKREYGMDTVAAIVEAGRRRLRPILMTTATTLLGVLPIALALGEGSEIQAPLARVVLGGLLVSTVITLVLLPALYVLTDRRRSPAKL